MKIARILPKYTCFFINERRAFFKARRVPFCLFLYCIDLHQFATHEAQTSRISLAEVIGGTK